MRQGLFALTLTVIIAACAGMAQADPVDLNTFTASDGVEVSVSGDAATFTENSDFLAFTLSNDLFEVTSASSISFAYSFTPDDAQYKDRFIFTINYEYDHPIFSTNGQTAGNLLFDLSGYAGQTISIEWGLWWGGANDAGELGPSSSFATIANVRLDSNPDTTPVPEPGTLLLMGTGLAGLAGWRRKKS